MKRSWRSKKENDKCATEGMTIACQKIHGQWSYKIIIYFSASFKALNLIEVMTEFPSWDMLKFPYDATTESFMPETVGYTELNTNENE